MSKLLGYATARDICVAFATRHQLEFTEDGSIGFGRHCVGFLRGARYIDHNPYHFTRDTVVCVAGTESELARPPRTVPDAYHKHDCLAVLVDGGDVKQGVIQLAEWVRHMENAGTVRIVAYAAEMDALMFLDPTAATSYAVVVDPSKEAP